MAEYSKNSKTFIAKLSAKIPPDFGRTKPELHYWILIPSILVQLAWATWRSYSGFGPSLTTGVALFASGILAWTLAEYLLHRFSFHSKSDHPLVRPFNSGLHLLHHQQPASRDYVAAPIVLVIPVYLVTFALFRFVSGSLESALLIGSGYAASFLFYEHVHYMSHQHNPKGRIMRSLKKHHMLHHFGNKERKFGVTSPLWDHIFRTYEAPIKARAHATPPNSGSIAS